MKSDKLKTSAKNNSEQDFEFSFYDDIDDALIEGLEQNQDFFTLLLNNAELKKEVLGIFSGEIYRSLREDSKAKNSRKYPDADTFSSWQMAAEEQTGLDDHSHRSSMEG